MSNITQIFNNESFGPEQVKAMGDAYDLIVKNFPDDDHKAVALAILVAARTGENDCDQIYDLALQALSTEENLPHHTEQRQEA